MQPAPFIAIHPVTSMAQPDARHSRTAEAAVAGYVAACASGRLHQTSEAFWNTACVSHRPA